MLHCGVDIDHAQTESPHVEAAVDVVEVALLDEFAEFCEGLVRLEEELVEGPD